MGRSVRFARNPGQERRIEGLTAIIAPRTAKKSSG
jgi:hypothetical protein